MQGCEANNDADKAILLLNEALKCNPEHSAASVALAKIHLARFASNSVIVLCCGVIFVSGILRNLS